MAMTILNNTAAQMTLGELNKNITQVGKELAKISKGERIYGAAASASEYAITENMRVKIRSLGQDEMNVKSGGDLMRLAEGAVQNQLNIMRTIKERVINAANDSNTDEDRKIIQKEINQFLNEIEDITYETNYNKRPLLYGNIVATREILKEWDEQNPVKALRGQKVSWEVLELPDGKDSAVVEGSSLDIIPNVYDSLDDVDGPFDIFTPFKSNNVATTLPALSLEASNRFTGGANGTPNYTTIDFSGYSSADEMDGLNFTIGNKTYILSTDTSARYDNAAGTSQYGVNYSGPTSRNSNYVMVDIKNKTPEQVVQQLASMTRFGDYTAKDMQGIPSSASDDLTSTGTELVLKTITAYDKASDANEITITNTQASNPTTKKVIYQEETSAHDLFNNRTTANYPNVSGTGKLPETYLTGGVLGVKASPYEPDVEPVTAQPPTMTIDISSSANKGITISYPNSTFKLKFLNDSSEFQWETTTHTGANRSNGSVSTGVCTVGINASSSYSVYTNKGTLTLSVSNGKITLTGPTLDYNPRDPSYDPNKTFSVADGITNHKYTYNSYSGQSQALEEISKVENFRALKKVTYTNEKTATDATRAYATIKLDPSEYSSGDNLADKLIGTEFSYNGKNYKFYDGSSTAPIYDNYPDRANGGSCNVKGCEAAPLTTGWIDISALRESPTTETLAGILKRSLTAPTGTSITTVGNEIRLPSNQVGAAGNNTYLNVFNGMELAHYDVDFTSYFANHPDLKLPDDLYGKGFQVYCASCAKQWFNFNFTGNVIEGQDDMPVVENAPDIKNIFVDISSVTEPTELVKKIEESANPQLAVSDHGHEHHIFTQALPGSGIIRIYDNRPYNPKDDKKMEEFDELGRKKLQDKGAKISDGLSDYLKKTYTNLYDDLIETIHHEIALNRKEERLIIHDTTKANRDITLHIPRMTLDQMVGVPEEDFDKELFSVMTKDSRDKMLGTLGAEHYADEKGYLDMAIDYLTNANSTIGSQITRLEQAEKNIVTQNETTTASESVIRDADMAKEMTNFTKNNVIAQAAQSMLAQANQTVGGVLELLQ